MAKAWKVVENSNSYELRMGLRRMLIIAIIILFIPGKFMLNQYYYAPIFL